jgi:hypothetical protein
MALWCCRSQKIPAEKTQRWQFGKKTEALMNVRKASTQKWTLKTKLKICRRTVAAGKNQPQMFHGLKQGFGLCAGRWRLFPAQTSANPIQPAPQIASQPINRFQHERQMDFFSRRLG